MQAKLKDVKVIIVLRSRCDSKYGIACSIPYEPGKHSQHFCYFHHKEQIYRSRDVFVVYLQKGEYMMKCSQLLLHLNVMNKPQ